MSPDRHHVFKFVISHCLFSCQDETLIFKTSDYLQNQNYFGNKLSQITQNSQFSRKMLNKNNFVCNVMWTNRTEPCCCIKISINQHIENFIPPVTLRGCLTLSVIISVGHRPTQSGLGFITMVQWYNFKLWSTLFSYITEIG